MKFCLVFLLITSSFLATAVEKAPVVSKLVLSEGQKTALRSAMFENQRRIEAMVDLLSRGQWEGLEKAALAIAKDPVLVKTSVGQEFPQEFKEHMLELVGAASTLAKAAKRHKGDLVMSNYYRILSTCMNCHARFAPNLFEQKKEYTPPQSLPPKYYKAPDDWR